MRPDEHKRKKNTDYKKKHGIPLNKNAKNNGGKDSNSSGSQDMREKSQKVEQKTANDGPFGEFPQLEHETRRFARRQIQSNWDRYEDNSFSDDDDKFHPIQRRGADFATLVQAAGNSHSQFRFQDEKEWEVSEDNSQALVSVLQINFRELSDSLKSLPIHKRLNLEEIDFNQMQECKPTQENGKHDKGERLLAEHTIQKHDTISLPAAMLSTLQNALPTQPNTDLNIDFVPHEIKTGKNRASNMKNTKTQLLFQERHVLEGGNPDSFDDELELLLSMESVAKQPAKRTDRKENTMLGDMTDNTIHRVVKKQMNGKENNVMKEETTKAKHEVMDDKESKNVTKKEENLEDWLDSMLA